MVLRFPFGVFSAEKGCCLMEGGKAYPGFADRKGCSNKE